MDDPWLLLHAHYSDRIVASAFKTHYREILTRKAQATASFTLGRVPLIDPHVAVASGRTMAFWAFLIEPMPGVARTCPNVNIHDYCPAHSPTGAVRQSRADQPACRSRWHAPG